MIRASRLAACAVALALTAGPALADPAVWAVKSKTSTVYLFGTVHMLDPDKPWRTPAFDRALREAGELWMEVPLPVTAKGSAQPFTPEAAQTIAQMTVKLGTVTDGPLLSSRLTTAEAAELASYLPMPQERWDHLRPWLAATLMQVTFYQRVGLSAAAGADYSLAQGAVDGGKPLKGFETIEQQLHFFADLTPDEELGFLHQVLADAGDGKAVLEAVERDWYAGDQEGLTKLLIGRLQRFPMFYRRFVADRNRSWIPGIETMLKTPGVRFVAVGGGHMLGPDGVLALLEKDGWKVERVQ
jgi:uncharacterized protein YbaP (TraB family)